MKLPHIHIKEKGLWAVVLACLVVVLAATSVLANTSKLSRIFNPSNFEGFETNRTDGDEYYLVSGNGENSNLADDDSNGENRSDGDKQKAKELDDSLQDDNKSEEKEQLESQPEESVQPLAQNTDDTSDSNGLVMAAEPQDDESYANTDTQAANLFDVSNNTDSENGITFSDSESDADENANGNTNISSSAGNGTENSISGISTGENAVSNGNGQNDVPVVIGNGNGTGNGMFYEDVNSSGTDSMTGTDNSGSSGQNSSADKNTSHTNDGNSTGNNGEAAQEGGNTGSSETGETSGGNTEKTLTWEERQLESDDPVVTDDGWELVSLKVTTPETWLFCLGDSYSDEEVTVTAVLRKNGETREQVISYGGSDGYTVNMSTKNAGSYKAIFSYNGLTARAEYEILTSSLEVKYYAVSEDGIYSAKYPGYPLLKVFGVETSQDEQVTIYPGSGMIANLTSYHHKMIAYLGDQTVQDTFLAQTSDSGYQTYSNVVFLESDEDGYLKTMATGFRYYFDKKIQDEESYVYYPMGYWGMRTARTVIEYVQAVPEGYKIKREVTGSGINAIGEQVLCAYTGKESTLSVPMGVTRIRLTSAAENVTTLVIPESVEYIDYASVRTYLPNLKEIQVSGTSHYKVVDGVLYSKDGKTLWLVPSGKTEITKWSDCVSVIAGSAFYGSSIRNLVVPAGVTQLNTSCFQNTKIETILFQGSTTAAQIKNTGYTGTVLVEDSAYDTICKNWVIAFANNSVTVGVVDANGQTITEKTGLYRYKSGKIVVYSKEPSVLAGISQDSSGLYQVPEGITAIGSGAFAAGTNVYEINLPASVAELREGSLASLGKIESIFISGDSVEVSPYVFGKNGTVPSITIYVPKDSYDDYLKKWSAVLDPVYGEKTAENLLAVSGEDYLYENGAKYQILEQEDGTIGYRLLKVYSNASLTFAAKEGTIETAKGAFSDCSKMEIIYLPDSMIKIEEGTFDGCGSLKALVVDAEGVTGLSEISTGMDASIYQPGDSWISYLYDDGIIYGISDVDVVPISETNQTGSAGGGYTLIKVPTDYTGTLVLWEGTEYLAPEACKNCTGITGITVKDHMLKKIGASCFENCTGLTKVNFSAQETLSTIGDYAFRNCTNLLSFIDKAVDTVGKGAFYNCTSMNTVSLSNITEISEECFYNCQSLIASSTCINVEKLTSVGDRAFAYCVSFQQFDNVPKLESLGEQAFYSCSTLTKVVLPETLTYLGEGCFRNCGSLESVELNGSLKSIGRYTFYGCTSLSTITFSDLQKENLQLIGAQAFAGCENLETMDFSDMKELTQLGERLFEGDTILSIVRLPESVVSLPNKCFADCGNFSILELHSEEPVALGESVFGEQVSPYTHIWVEDDVLSVYEEAYQPLLDGTYGDGTTEAVLGVIQSNREIIRGIIFEKNEDGDWILLTAPETLSGSYTVPERVTRIEDEAFKDCKLLTSIELPYGSSISLGNRCFIGCDNLKSVYLYCDIPEWGDETFMDCTSLEYVTIGKDSTNKIPRIGTRAFKNCTGLSGTYAVYFMAQINVIGEESFSGCTNLVGVPCSTATAHYQALEQIEDRAFENCISMTSATGCSRNYPNLKSIGAYAYYNCDSLKTPSVPEGVTSIGEGCFAECDGLLAVSFYGPVEEYPKDCFKNCPNLDRTAGTAAAVKALKRIGESAYEGCVSLTLSGKWVLKNYTNLEEIGENAFKGASMYSKWTLPATVRKIGAGAFDGCSGLKTLELLSKTPPQIGAIDFSTVSESFSLLVPDSYSASDSSASDSVYLTYLETLSEVLGVENTYAILDSSTDGAKSRCTQEKLDEIRKKLNPDASVEETSGEESSEEQTSNTETSGAEESDNETSEASVNQNSAESTSGAEKSSEESSRSAEGSSEPESTQSTESSSEPESTESSSEPEGTQSTESSSEPESTQSTESSSEPEGTQSTESSSEPESTQSTENSRESENTQ